MNWMTPEQEDLVARVAVRRAELTSRGEVLVCIVLPPRSFPELTYLLGLPVVRFDLGGLRVEQDGFALAVIR